MYNIASCFKFSILFHYFIKVFHFRYRFSDPLGILQLYPLDLRIHLEKKFLRFKQKIVDIVDVLPSKTEISFILPSPRIKTFHKKTVLANLSIYFFYCHMKTWPIGRIIDPFMDTWVQGVGSLLHTDHFNELEKIQPFRYSYGAVHLSNRTYGKINQLIIQ